MAPPRVCESLRNVFRFAVDVHVGAEFARERLFVLAARDGDGTETHFCGELDAQMAETANSEDSDEIPRAGAALPQRVEGCDTGADERTGIDRGEVIRYGCQGLEGRDHVIGIAAVVGNPGNQEVYTGDEVAAPAGLAMAAMAAVSTDADALAGFPFGHVRSECIDHAGDLVSWDTGVTNARPASFHGERVTVTNPAGLNFDADMTGTGLRNIAFHHLEGPGCVGNLNCSHFRHSA